MDLVAQLQQEGKIRILQQQSGIVVDIVIKIWNSAALRKVFFVFVVATFHKIPCNPFCIALLVLVVNDVTNDAAVVVAAVVEADDLTLLCLHQNNTEVPLELTSLRDGDLLLFAATETNYPSP